MKKKIPSLNRMQARELEKKVVPAIKKLSQHMHGTNQEVPTSDFHGYEIPAGTFTLGALKWQIKVQAVCSKSLMIKNDIKPIIRKGAWMFKIRLFLTVVSKKLTNWLNK